MVELIAKTLARLTGRGFHRGVLPEVPYRPDLVHVNACSLRGITDTSLSQQVLALPGDEMDILRHLRGVIVAGDRAPSAFDEGARVSLVVFRGVFGCGGYGIRVRSVRMADWSLQVDCTFEDPGCGLRTSTGFTQPAAIIPLARLPRGKYRAVVVANVVERSATEMREKQSMREIGRLTFRIR